MRMLKRPDTDTIADEFERKFRDGVLKIENMEACQPLFRESEISETPFVLDRMLRTICVHRGITKELWSLLCMEYCYKVLALTKKQSTNKANNATKAFRRAPVTMATFDFFRKAIGLRKFVFVKFGFIDVKGNEVEYKIDMLNRSTCIEEEVQK